MKLISTFAVAQFFLLATAGGEVPKKVGCYYMNRKFTRNTPLLPEDVDASICSQLMYWKGNIDDESGEINVPETEPQWIKDGEGFLPRLVKLKAINPDLKLILLINSEDLLLMMVPSRRDVFIKNGVKWLNETSFDGFQFFFQRQNVVWEQQGDLLCDMKSEFKKHGYMLLTMLTDKKLFEASIGNEEPFSKMDRCTDHVTLMLEKPGYNRLAPMNMIKSNVDWYIERGMSAEKIKICVPTFGMLIRPDDSNNKDAGSDAGTEPKVTDEDIDKGIPLQYQELQRRLNDSSSGWTIRRNESTKEAYSYSKTGLWISYEDTESMSFKAQYVLEKGLAGMDVIAIQMDDDEGITGEGRFPLTRAIYNTFRRQNETVDATP